jgi:septation ring formation regulator EzrA
LNGIIAAADKEINRLTTSINKNKTTMSSFDGQIDSAENELVGMKEKLDTLTKIDVD